MMDETDYVLVSALERFRFCHRQAYLFHTENARADNRFTIEGTLLHERVTAGEDDTRPGVRITRSLQIVCHRLGLCGVADVVEFRGGRPIPVEYKRGKRTRRACEQTQLCAQALCLEEMLNVHVPLGYIYHAQSRRREEVLIDAQLRDETERLVVEVRSCLRELVAPPAIEAPHCQSCSLLNHCQPHVTKGGMSVTSYLWKLLR
ncbi:MAG: CRISPR-associated protein Cas4 [Minicystis sp.]